MDPSLIYYINLPVVIGPEDIDQMHSVLESVENKAGPKVLVIRGKDPKKFCHGMNLKYLKKVGMQAAIRLAEAILKVCARIMKQNCPVLCVINGHAIAGGMVIALSADYLLMNSDSGTLGMTEILINLVIPRSIMMLIKEKFSPADFRDLILRPKTFNAKQALKAKVIDEAVPWDQLESRALKIVEEMLENKDLYMNARNFRMSRHSRTIDNLTLGDFGRDFVEAMAMDGVKL